jgi:hypothetical protein
MGPAGVMLGQAPTPQRRQPSWRNPVMPASVWIINLVVLGVVLEADLGRRKITWFRLARPVIVAGAIVIYYLTKTPVATRSGGLAFELALAALGIVLGVVAGLIFRVFRDRGISWSQAGIAYALLWIVVIGARIGFAYATSHSRSVQVWLGTQHITSDAVTDALIFMAIGMLLTRTATLRLRAAALPADVSGDERTAQPPANSWPAPPSSPASPADR